MNVSQFVAKWRQVALTERSASQQHFLDLCRVFDHRTPAEMDHTGESFTFEKGATKHGGGRGWADVWKRAFFGWEYKGKHKDLAAAYDQLLLYRETLENPPLLVVCDMDRFVIHTNFTATAKKTYEITLDDLDTPRNIEILRHVFFEPEKLRPSATSDAITREVAERLAGVAKTLRDRGFDPTVVARFLDRIVFCLFAEDVGLLPKKLFSEIAENAQSPKQFADLMGQLFAAMANGGYIFVHPIRHFNGNLFVESPVIELTAAEIKHVQAAARLDWSAVDPSIFGTLFQRGLDPDTRAQLGAQYTSREDIETLIEPVVMQPLKREWEATQVQIDNLLRTGKLNPKGNDKPLTKDAANKAHRQARTRLRAFHERLAHIKVLDPACGSGNFLYVTLQKLKDLEKEVLVYASDRGLGSFLALVSPLQFYGIEFNPYAFELAQTTLWIGYLQWIQANGFGVPAEPILREMNNFENMDAILDRSDPENPRSPEWPEADFIVGNPPFLGGKRLRTELGDDYVDKLFHVYESQVPAEADLVAYWFEKARQQIKTERAQRVGLLATQGIRGGANREVLKRIKESGDIFFAESDRPWILEGANVHVSMIGFDDGSEARRVLDSHVVESINANLTSVADVTQATPLLDNLGIAFMGDTKGGAFDIDQEIALAMLDAPNPHGRPNSDVIVPWINGFDITRRPQGKFIIDFAMRKEEEAALYQQPFDHIKRHVWPVRKNNNREAYRVSWWRHVEPRPGMYAALSNRLRFLCTPRVAKHRLFVWMRWPTLCDSATFVFAREDDYFFGLLQSRIHEVWALKLGTRLETRPRYTATTSFETFPLPLPSDKENEAIANAARTLHQLRENWLNPAEWTMEETLVFRGSITGPWQLYVSDPDERGIGTVRYSRAVPIDENAAMQLAQRTLTNLYNERPTWLDLAHRKLDEAVFAAYGWESTLSDEDILARLLELNQAQSRD